MIVLTVDNMHIMGYYLLLVLYDISQVKVIVMFINVCKKIMHLTFSDFIKLENYGEVLEGENSCSILKLGPFL